VRFRDAQRAAVILGAADGLTLAISEIMSLRAHQAAVFRSGLGAGLGELVGMTAALWLSAGDDRQGFWPALGCGAATLLGCVVPCLPFLLGGPGAFALAGALIIVLGSAVCWIRPQRGLRAVAETFGVLAAAGLLCFASSLL
jgi:hypothetical protein